jgi:hypothetical protein
MRMSSEMFPFASHPVYGYSLEYCAEELAAVGALAKKYGHRLTTHPGQFTQIGSPKPDVVTNAIRDLSYHCEMIDRMGLGKDSVMIIHVRSVYGLLLVLCQGANRMTTHRVVACMVTRQPHLNEFARSTPSDFLRTSRTAWY